MDPDRRRHFATFGAARESRRVSFRPRETSAEAAASTSRLRRPPPRSRSEAYVGSSSADASQTMLGRVISKVKIAILCRVVQKCCAWLE